MNKKIVGVALATCVGAVVVTKLLKKQKFSQEEQEKIDEYTKYLEDKNFVIVEKSKYNSPSSALFSISAIPTYYKVAKTVAKYVL